MGKPISKSKKSKASNCYRAFWGRNKQTEKKMKKLKALPKGKKSKGLRKLPKKVRNKMGFMKKGGKVK